MKVDRIFFRHARAFTRDQDRFPRDFERPLTDEGKTEFLKMALALRPRFKHVEKIVTSPFLRSVETAQILADLLPGVSVVQEGALSQDAQLEELTQLFMNMRSESDLIFVGHEPILSQLLSFLLYPGNADHRVKMKKGAGCCLRWKDIEDMGQLPAEIRWLIDPRLIHFL